MCIPVLYEMMDKDERNGYVYGPVDENETKETAVASVELAVSPPGPPRDYPECSWKAALKTSATYIAFLAGVSAEPI